MSGAPLSGAAPTARSLRSYPWALIAVALELESNDPALTAAFDRLALRGRLCLACKAAAHGGLSWGPF